MRGNITKGLGWLMLSLACCYVLTISPSRAEELGGETNPIQIGMVGTLMQDVPESLVAAMSVPFNKIMVNQTGMSGRLVKVAQPADLAKQLTEKDVQLGIFHGIEFAWARQEHPKLKPLMIIVNEQSKLHALLVVKQDCAAGDLADLKGQKLTRPKGCRAHCLLYLNRRCEELGGTPKEVFSEIADARSAEDALDDVFEGLAYAALVDSVSHDIYKRRKPNRSSKLKVLHKSEVFPAAVVAYSPESLDKPTLKRFREGMVTAHQTAQGKQMLNLFRITGFQEVPDDYEKTLKEIVKAYPQPEKK